MEKIVKKTWDLLEEYKKETPSRENSLAIRKLEEILQYKMWLANTRQFLADSFKEDYGTSSDETIELIKALQENDEIVFDSYSYEASTGDGVYSFNHKGKNKILIGDDEVESFLNSRDDI